MVKKKEIKYIIVDGSDYTEHSTPKEVEEEIKTMIKDDIPEEEINVYEIKKISKVKLEIKLE